MEKMGEKRGFLEMPFGWMFAIVVGGFILFLAIFAVVKILNTGQEEVSAKTSKEIGVLLNPLEIGFENAKINSFSMPAESRIYNRCSLEGNFGKQLINVQQKSFNKWSETDINVGFQNKYIFSDKYEEGKNFLLFSKPFEFPFKVSDLIYLTSSNKQYCFSGLSGNVELGDIKNELENLGQENIKVGNCSNTNEEVKICLSNSNNCDVIVNYAQGVVTKNSTNLYFETDALMYAAIFSDPAVYECQVKRLMKRANELSLIYREKATFISNRGCTTNLNPDLTILSSLSLNLQSSSQLKNIMENNVAGIEYKNDLASCKLW